MIKDKNWDKRKKETKIKKEIVEKAERVKK